MPTTKVTQNFPDTPAARPVWLKNAGGLEAAIASGRLSSVVTLSLAEALVLGLMRQGVTKYLAIFGHGSTAIAEVLRHYEAAGLVRCFQFRNEVEMAHAGTALRWVYGETCAVVTSIGPGALQALSGSLVAASNGIGVYHIYGDETTRGEGYNMQQVPKPAQGLFGQMTAVMGRSYTLHDPAALRAALRMGASTVFHPWRPGPFYLNVPINTQPEAVSVRLDALPLAPVPSLSIPVEQHGFERAVDLISGAERVVIKAGGGTRGCAAQLRAFCEAAGAPVVLSPGSVGVLPDQHPQNMHVGGSKGSISGNFTMENGEVLVVIGSRAVCQSDCSGIGWPKVCDVININADPIDVQHYNRTISLNGDAGKILEKLTRMLAHHDSEQTKDKAGWLDTCAAKKGEWSAFKAAQYGAAAPTDPVWNRPVLTQPQAIKTAADFCRDVNAVKFFDAGDVQANGFQIVEDDAPGETYTDTGTSYMGFAVSALLAGGIADIGRHSVAFTGDGSFMMNPQVLIDGVEHGVHGTIIVFDNRRMAAISQLQVAQYGVDFRTHDGVAVDYVQMAGAVRGVMAIFGGHDRITFRKALEEAHAYSGLSLVHVPVYYGEGTFAGMGAYGQWNVGNWCNDVQQQYIGTLI
jgi:3D-(3,5/4)-trihydroxycyclohexane-1,2-dione acylhydrolase (decyclizing)